MNYHKSSNQAKKLCHALNDKGLKCVLEHPSDGHKHIDIRIVDARIDIEVDGDEHYTNPKKIESDVKRRYWSSQEKHVTIHIPNHIIDLKFDKVVDAIFQVAITRKQMLKI